MGLMTAVATFINESKRKKEIVLKYRNSGQEEKLSTKFSRLNMHSVAKKSSRFGMLLKTSLGMAPTVSCISFLSYISSYLSPDRICLLKVIRFSDKRYSFRGSRNSFWGTVSCHPNSIARHYGSMRSTENHIEDAV